MPHHEEEIHFEKLPLATLAHYTPTPKLQCRIHQVHANLTAMKGQCPLIQDFCAITDCKKAVLLAENLCKQFQGLKVNKAPQYRANSIQLYANNLCFNRKQKQALFDNKIYTVNDVLKSPATLMRAAGQAEGTRLLAHINELHSTASENPTAEEALNLANKFYDKEEENNPSSKAVLNTGLAEIQALFHAPRAGEETDLSKAIMKKLSYVNALANQVALHFDDFDQVPKIRDVVATYYDQLFNDISKMDDSSKKKAALFEGLQFVVEFYSHYKSVGSDLMWSQDLQNLGVVKSTDTKQSVRDALFDKQFYFYYQALQRQQELANLVGQKVANDIITAIQLEESQAFITKFGSEAAKYDKQDLNMAQNDSYKRWIPRLCYAFADDETKRYYKPTDPADENPSWLSYFLPGPDGKDKSVIYDKDKDGKGIAMTYKEYFKKLAFFQAVYSISGSNKQDRVHINKKAAENAINDHVNSSAGRGIMFNVKARCYAYYFSDINPQYRISYTSGNQELYTKWTGYLAQPSVQSLIGKTLIPDSDQFTDEQNRNTYFRYYEECITKLMIIKPDLNLVDAESIFQPVVTAMLQEQSIKQIFQLADQAAAVPNAKEALDSSIRKALEQTLKELLEKIKEATGDMLAFLKEQYKTLQDISDAGFQANTLNAISRCFTKLFAGDFAKWPETGFFRKCWTFTKNSVRFLAKALAAASFCLVVFLTIFKGGSMSWQDIVVTVAQLTVQLAEYVVKYVPKLLMKFGKYIEERGWSFSKGFFNKTFSVGESIAKFGNVIEVIGNVVGAIVSFYQAYSAFNSASEAFERDDVVSGYLYQTAGILYLIAGYLYLIALIPGAQAAAVIATVLVVIAQILEILVSVFQDDEVTSYLKKMKQLYPTESKGILDD